MRTRSTKPELGKPDLIAPATQVRRKRRRTSSKDEVPGRSQQQQTRVWRETESQPYQIKHGVLVLRRLCVPSLCTVLGRPRQTKRARTAVRQIHTVHITRFATSALLDLEKTDLQNLEKDIPVLCDTIPIRHLILETMDNMYKHKHKSALDILDTLAERWLQGGLESITSIGTFHRIRHSFYDHPRSSRLLHRLVFRDIHNPILQFRKAPTRAGRSHWGLSFPFQNHTPAGRVDWLVQQVQPHVNVVASLNIKIKWNLRLEMVCHEASKEELDRVMEELVAGLRISNARDFYTLTAPLNKHKRAITFLTLRHSNSSEECVG